MADQPRTPETDDTGRVVERGSPPRMPAWVKWPGVVIGILVVLFLASRLFGLEHGPGLHTPGGDNAPASVTPSGHAPGGGRG